ncbi:MAG: hypothetical protein AAF251_06410 [Pseudomonadota bacterium]
MTQSVCVYHIEDEYQDLLKIWPNKLKTLWEIHWLEKGEDCPIAKIRDITPAEGAADGWAAREISCPMGTDQIFRYILVSGVTVPESAKKLMLERACFVIDVLRNGNQDGTHSKTAISSLDDVAAMGSTNDNTVLFTACQGSDLVKIKEKYDAIEVIQKLEPSRLQKWLSRMIVESMS